MIYTDKDEHFKKLYDDSLGDEDISCDVISSYCHNEINRMVFDKKIILEVKSFDSYISKDNNIKIKDSDGNEIGYIVFVNKGIKVVDNLDVFTCDEILFIWGFYRDKGILPDSLDVDILVLNKNYIELYLTKYYETSSLWGGFIHEDRVLKLCFDKNDIFLPRNKIRFPTTINEINSYQSVLSANIYDNFLKNYHQLELVFNFIFIMKLKKTEISNIKDVNAIYKNILKEEIESINYMVSNFTSSKLEYIKLIVKSFVDYKTISDEIFHDYGKESNPLKDMGLRDRFVDFINECNANDFNTFQEYEDLAKSKRFKSNKDELTKFTNNFTSYMIYRIRCSIAHNKISEFIFMPNDDAHFKFMADISMPILKQVVIDVFSNSEFNSIFDD